MATRSVSPGGALLRASRVFAIPNPLPQPTSDLSSTAVFNSDSATLPHPVDLSITTPQSSLKRGDWGFKRPLPLRSTTRTSTPFIRVKHIDTFEHITEFGSAADHTLNLLKWQEMGIPISTPVKNASSTPGSNFPTDNQGSGKTVFEEKYDTIAPADGTALGKDDVRWKFSGPWLAGLNEGEFNAYVHGQVRKRKDDFRHFLAGACAVETTQALRREASDQGLDPEQLPPSLEASDITPEQLTEYIKDIRNDRVKLYRHIRSFLDLPPASTSSNENWADLFSQMQRKPEQPLSEPVEDFDSPYAKSGPPKTHPSAGLAYSRSSSHLFNHPIYGPQKSKPPVQARVVMPKAAATGSFAAVLGVGGFVTNVPAGVQTGFNANNLRGRQSSHQTIPGTMAVEPDKEGGSLTWVQPKHARIDPKGRVVLNVVMADPEAIAVHTDTVGEIPTEHKRPMQKMFSPPTNAASLSNSFGYGLSPKKTDTNGMEAFKELESRVQGR
jgi:hypothetical protein